MNSTVIQGLNLNVDELRASIKEEYSAVANEPERGFHFHTGHKLAGILGYQDKWLDITRAANCAKEDRFFCCHKISL